MTTYSVNSVHPQPLKIPVAFGANFPLFNVIFRLTECTKSKGGEMTSKARSFGKSGGWKFGFIIFFTILWRIPFRKFEAPARILYVEFFFKKQWAAVMTIVDDSIEPPHWLAPSLWILTM